MKNNTSLVYSAFLVVGDFLALVAAFVGAYIIRVSLNHAPLAAQVHSRTYLSIFLALLPFWILIFALLGLYNGSVYEKRFSEVGRLLVGSFIGLLFVIAWAYFDNRPIFPAKAVPIYGFGLAFGFLVIFRNLARSARNTLFRYNIGITNILIIGNTEITNELKRSLATLASGYRIIGVINGHSRSSGIRHFSSFKVAVAALETNQIHGVVQTELYADVDKNNEILEFCQTRHIAYRFIPGNLELFIGKIDVELFRAAIPVIAVHQTALLGWGRIVKRAFDVVAGSLMLLVALPFIAVIFILQLFTGGDVFFKQKRLTRFNQTFTVYKFRTIKPRFNGLSPESAFTKLGRPDLTEAYRAGGDKLRHDPRYGWFGNFLRITSMDELPQLINVVRGDISLVGPRALVPEELSSHEKRHAILSVKSGLTGLAQVSGRRNISFEERRKLDMYYVQNWSFWLDLTILAKTIRAVLAGGVS